MSAAASDRSLAAEPSAPAVQRRARRYYVLTFGLTLLLALAMLAFSGWFILQARDAAFDRASSANQNLAEAVAQHAARTFEAVDTALGVVSAAIRVHGSQEGNAALHQVLRQRTGASPQIRALVVIDANGRGVLDSEATPPRPIDVGQDDFFRRHAEADFGLIISPTRRSRQDGAWIILLTRRIQDAEGNFAGVIAAVVDPDYFRRSFAQIDIGRSGAISLFQTDGVMMVREPPQEDALGRSFQDTALFRTLLPQSESGSTTVRSALDGVERLLSYRRVEGFPLVVSVASAKSEALEEWRAGALRDGGFALMLAVTLALFGHFLGRALRRRTLAEAGLQQQNAVLETILKTLPYGVQVVDDRLQMTVWNRQLFDILDVDADALLSAPDPRLALVKTFVERGEHGPGDPQALVEQRQAIPREGRPVHYRRQLVGGKWIEVHGTPVPGLGYLKVYRDITDEIFREAELRDAKDRLEEQASDLAAALEGLELARIKANEDRLAAEAASEASSRFLANMSHELRTPMTGVVGMVDFLRGTSLTAQQRQYVDTLHISAETLLTVINDILDFSKIEAGKLTLEQIDFDLVTRVEAVVQLLQPKASEKGILLKSALAPALPRYLRGDPMRLQQVLFNLVGNAIKFTQQGHVEVACRAEPGGSGPLRIEIEVRDTGIGLSEEQQQRLFVPFSQADDTTSRRFGGTGLGLAISRRLVEFMGGVIGVRSAPGKGSVFWVQVPFLAGERPAQAERRDAVTATVPSMRLLLAEDNSVNRMLIAAGLERLGHTVTAVENGREAVDALKMTRFDVVIMDMQMPVLDGIDATREIRQIPGAVGQVPVIGLSADAMPGHLAAYEAAGLTAYLLKPVDWELLNRTLAGFAGTGSAADNPAAPRVQPQNGATPLLDGERLANVEGVMGRGKMLELLNMFPPIARDHSNAIADAMARSDVPAAKAAAHAIKGMAASLGALRVAELARIFDEIVELPDPAVQRELDAAIEATTRAITALG